MAPVDWGAVKNSLVNTGKSFVNYVGSGQLEKDLDQGLYDIANVLPSLHIPSVPEGACAEAAANAGWQSQELLDELANSGVKYNPNDVVAVTKTPDGKLVWLENGNSQAGLNHILNHADDFAAKGIQESEIPDLVMDALTNGKIVGYQGQGTGRPIYEVTYNGTVQRVAITVGSNGFIVGANPTSIK